MIICTLNKLMEDNEITQSKLASETGITRPTLLSLIRNDNQSIKYETINQLCNFFNVDMSELLVYSPVNVEFKKVVIDSIVFKATNKKDESNNQHAVSLIYAINGKEYEFDTNLFVSKENNSLRNSGKFFFNLLIYDDDYKILEHKGFDKNFIKLYSDSINIEEIIKNELKTFNLNSDFKIKHYEVDIQTMERTNDTFNDLIQELKSLVNDTPFKQNEKNIMLEKIKDIEKTKNEGV